MKDIKNKVVVLAGGCGKLGLSFAHSIIAHGGKVAIFDISEKSGKQIEKKYKKKSLVYFKCDIKNANQIDACFGKVNQLFGKIDAVVNSTYPLPKKIRTKFENLNMNFLSNELKNHLGAAIIFSQRAIRYFLKKGKGNIIHISSIHGVNVPKFEHYRGTKMMAPIEYCSVKSGIISMVKYLAKYYKGKKIKINSLSPGGISNNQSKKFIKRYKSSCLNKGMLDPEDINGTLLFLLSDTSKYVNGQNIVVDDGWVL